MIIEVEDDGVGMGFATSPLSTSPLSTRLHAGRGIGMANVAERLQVLYGDTATMTVDSREGKGTLVRLRLPVLQDREGLPGALYEERSSTRR